MKREQNQFVTYPMPLSVSGPNQGFRVPPAFEPRQGLFTHHFRDFSFGIVDEEAMILRYNRSNEGNELIVACLILSEDSQAE